MSASVEGFQGHLHRVHLSRSPSLMDRGLDDEDASEIEQVMDPPLLGRPTPSHGKRKGDL